MSADELHYGRLIPLEGDIEENAKAICLERGIELSEDEHKEGKTWYQLLKEELYGDEYLIMKDKIYKIEDIEQRDDPYVEIIRKNDDGTFSYVVSFYNCGTCLTECLHDMLENI